MASTTQIKNIPTLQVENHESDTEKEHEIKEQMSSFLDQTVYYNEDSDEEHDYTVRNRMVKKIGKGVVLKKCKRKYTRDFRDKKREKDSRSKKKTKRSTPEKYVNPTQKELIRQSCEWMMTCNEVFVMGK